MKNEEMLRLRLEGKSHKEIAELSTKQGRPVSKQRVVEILKKFNVRKRYVQDGAGKAQGKAERGIKGVLDKIVLKVKKYV